MLTDIVNFVWILTVLIVSLSIPFLFRGNRNEGSLKSGIKLRFIMLLWVLILIILQIFDFVSGNRSFYLFYLLWHISCLILVISLPVIIRGNKQERIVKQTIRSREKSLQKEGPELISPFLLMLLTRQVHLPWTAAFLHIDLQTLLDQLNAWNTKEHALQFSESGTIVSFLEPTINAFAQLLRMEYDHWQISGETEKKQQGTSPKLEAGSMKGSRRLDQLLGFLKAVLAGEASFPLKDIAEFLGIAEDMLIIRINRMSQVRIEDENFIIPMILWEDIPKGNDGLLDKDHFIATLDVKFARWGDEAKKKTD